MVPRAARARGFFSQPAESVKKMWAEELSPRNPNKVATLSACEEITPFHVSFHHCYRHLAELSLYVR